MHELFIIVSSYMINIWEVCMLRCILCEKEQKSLVNLSRHLSNNHKFSPREYYDLYMKVDNEDECVICKKQTRYSQFTKGYNNTCSRNCGAILFRKELKDDTDRFTSFRNIVSNNQTRIWKEREETINQDGNTGKEVIAKQVSRTKKENTSLMTSEERKERFGWLNKLSIDEKIAWKKENMFTTGCHRFWRNATEEDKQIIRKKRKETMIRNGVMIPETRKTDKKSYYNQVRWITAKTYKKYKNIINPNNLIICKGNNGYQIDHIVSIQQGFINNISPEIIGSIYNLQILSGKANNKKSYKNGQTISELLEKYGK